MIYKIICFVLGALSLFGVYYSNKAPIYSSVSYATSNYLDVYFTDAYSLNNTKVTTNKQTIILDNINLKHPGDYEIIKYKGFNNTYNTDVAIDIYINGVKSYKDDYFTITCTDNDIVKSNSEFTGEIKVTLNKAVVENKKLDFKIDLQIKRVS